MTESEYVAMMHSMKEALWLCSLLAELFSSLKAPLPFSLTTKQ